ncbi:FAD-dependent oxidoreductase [Fodinicurvata halophila]|uniref:FAD-dependent oxidoreductase n=1 Tax=Fodinicurvata halophila TaxID=1419723 RepID=A0ABV8UIW1_9PROT
MKRQPVIVGAGPAGVRAAETLVKAGLRPVVLDEGFKAGGQIYRQPPVPDGREPEDLYGSEAEKACALHETFERIRPNIDYRPRTLAWNVIGDTVDYYDESADVAGRLQASHLVLATGATDRTLPLPGWTLPGVYSLGGAQISLKAHHSLIGREVVFVGTGPLLYLVSLQYAKAGADVKAVVETASWSNQLRHASGLAHLPYAAVRGVGFMLSLRRMGVPIYRGAHAIRFEGDPDDGLSAVSFESGGRSHQLSCVAAAMGFGVRSEWQLAELAGAQLNWSDIQQQWVPALTDHVRASVDSLYLAGDGAGVCGAEAAEMRGELAGFALLQDLGHSVDSGRRQVLEKTLKKQWRVRAALDRMYPVPMHLLDELAEDTLVCRCEAIAAGEIRHILVRPGAEDVNRAKAFSRAGMGRCQGRMCALNVQAIVERAKEQGPQAIGWQRTQPPIKPVPMAAMADAYVPDPEGTRE